MISGRNGISESDFPVIAFPEKGEQRFLTEIFLSDPSSENQQTWGWRWRYDPQTWVILRGEPFTTTGANVSGHSTGKNRYW